MAGTTVNTYETLIPRLDQDLEASPARPTPQKYTPVPDVEVYHPSNPETSRSESSTPSISITASSNLEIATETWTLGDNNGNEMLGKSFDDNLAAITSKNADLLDNIEALPWVILTENRLMQLTNRAGQFLGSEAWVKDPISVRRYTNIRNKWFYLALKYKNQRSNMLYTIETNLSAITYQQSNN